MQTLSPAKTEPARLARFALVGASGAVVDFTVLNLLHGLAGWPLVPANCASVSVAIANNFAWNRRWTFAEARGAARLPQFSRFLLVSLIGLLLNTAILVLAHHALEAHLRGALRTNVAKGIAVLVVLFWNYAANRLWTFRSGVPGKPGGLRSARGGG